VFLVTGATGTVGRALTSLLLTEGAKVRAVTRNPRTAGLPDGAEVVEADPTSADTLADPLVGATAVFLNPAATGEATGRILELAAERGVTRAVLLSAAVVEDGVAEQSNILAAWHKGIEDAVTGSGLQWTIVRPGEFASNAAQQWGSQIRDTGVVRAAYGQSTTAPIHERDVAAVSMRALVSGEHARARYLLTGPQSLTRAEMVRILAEAIGRPVRFEEVSRDRALQALVGLGAPRPIVETMLDWQAASQHREAFVSPVVEQVTGRPALSFAQWAADHVADFV